MIVDRRYWGGRCCTYVREDGFTCGVGAYAPEVCIMERRLSIFVKSRMFGFAVIVKVPGGRGIPCHSKAIYIEQAVSSCDLLLCRYLIWIMGQQLGKIASNFINDERQNNAQLTGRALALQERGPKKSQRK